MLFRSNKKDDANVSKRFQQKAIELVNAWRNDSRLNARDAIVARAAFMALFSSDPLFDRERFAEECGLQ